MSSRQSDFPAFRAQLKPMRSTRERVAKAKSHHHLESLAGSFLPRELFDELASRPGTRMRWLPLGLVFWAFLNMIFHPGSPCREAQRSIQAWWKQRNRLWRNPCSSAFCAARARLPLDWLRRLWQRSAERLSESALPLASCHGRRVLVVDGTSVHTPDTMQNQRQWPQSSSQKAGCGFPLINLLGIFCLGSGALLHAAHGCLRMSEGRMFACLRRLLRKGDIVLGDRGFYSFGTFAVLALRGVDTIVRGRNAGKVDWRKGVRLGKNDRLVTLKRPSGSQESKVIGGRLWRRLPEIITVRRLRAQITLPGFRSKELLLITTLVDPLQWPLETLVALYLRRWRVELFFDDIKTTMQASYMRCLSPDMVRRELLMHAIAYNLVRRIMLQCAWQEAAPLDQLSFKGTLDTLRHWQHAAATQSTEHSRQAVLQTMLEICALDLLPLRPGRSEPRCLKRRPKGYQLLRRHRRQMRVSASRFYQHKTKKKLSRLVH